ncbi:hypothetical protein [Aeromicrobium sp. 179-A 4D2 NHS]|uniref:hypothetical protein n=1 Tax=Aeromicrobium sp. 179-A 4D2 NHS TaxID=3142375 RepID=UPI0039A2185E
MNVIEHPELDDPKDRLGHPGAHPWRLGHCGTCDVVTLPYIIRKVDPTNIADEIRRTVRRIRWAIRDRFGR